MTSFAAEIVEIHRLGLASADADAHGLGYRHGIQQIPQFGGYGFLTHRNPKYAGPNCFDLNHTFPS
ncbi:MAG: hypothetical protein MUQ10_01525 [Anaerolineae bacterium]|nr:hypothetical protein [Anaerolineae bacterium]